MNIQDIAKLAGVSASTVSKVMNGKDKDISEETRKKVLEVIEKENYIPYSKFREKAGMKSHLIGLILKTQNRERENIILTVEKKAKEKGYGLLINYAETQKEIEFCAEEMRQKKVEGILVDSDKNLSVCGFENSCIYFNQTKEFDEKQKVTFYYRLSEAGRLAVERLHKEGHEKIACIILNKDKAICDGYEMAMRSMNMQIQPMWIYEGKTIEDIEKYGIRQCLSKKVTAVVCSSPEIAYCLYKIMERTRMSVPDTLSIISIGESRLLELIGDGITSVKLPAENMSSDAVEYLVEMIQKEKKSELMRKFSPILIERNSITKPAQEKQGEKIVVVGSMNMDTTVEVSRIPVNSETQLAERLYVFTGGKGGNQAVGVGKLGGQVYMIGCLGNDMDGKQLYSTLVENHVHVDGVLFDNELPSGKAYINVDKNGESTIVVYQGANRNLSIEQINRCKHLFQNAKYCLLSLEIPKAIAEYTIKFCKRNDTQVILKPSAADKIKEELLKDIDYFIPNEKELHNFVQGKGTIEKKAKVLLDKGVENVIVTRGEKGCYLRNKDYSMYFEGSGFEAVDTTGGADSFISALAVCLSEGKNIIQAIGFAIYASGISVTRHGVQPALPDRKAVEIYEDEIRSKYGKGEEEKR